PYSTSTPLTEAVPSRASAVHTPSIVFLLLIGQPEHHQTGTPPPAPRGLCRAGHRLKARRAARTPPQPPRPRHNRNLGVIRVADLAQVIFGLGLEIQRRDVVKNQAQPTPVGRMGQALLSDDIAVLTGIDPREVSLNCL